MSSLQTNTVCHHGRCLLHLCCSCYASRVCAWTSSFHHLCPFFITTYSAGLGTVHHTRILGYNGKSINLSWVVAYRTESIWIGINGKEAYMYPLLRFPTTMVSASISMLKIHNLPSQSRAIYPPPNINSNKTVLLFVAPKVSLKNSSLPRPSIPVRPAEAKRTVSDTMVLCLESAFCPSR